MKTTQMHLTKETVRKSLRLPKYDYTLGGYYYITLCTQNRLCLFGEIKNDEMILNKAGEMVRNIWVDIPSKYYGINNDAFIIMPNHLHGILIIRDLAGPARGPAPTLSLPELMRNFKSLTTRIYTQGVREHGYIGFDKKLWQRSYYEHIIRNERSLINIRQYIINNPTKWLADRENPQNL